MGQISCKDANNNPITSNLCHFVLVQQTRMIKTKISKKRQELKKIIPAVSLQVLPGSISSNLINLTYCVKPKLKLTQTLFCVQVNCLPLSGYLNLEMAQAVQNFRKFLIPERFPDVFRGYKN